MNSQQTAPPKYTAAISQMNELYPERSMKSWISQPPMAGAANVARFPIMFMEPETVPAYLPPMSITAVHAGGMVTSFEKLAMPMAIMAHSAL